MSCNRNQNRRCAQKMNINWMSLCSSWFYILKWESVHVLCEFDTICVTTNKPLAVDISTCERAKAHTHAFKSLPSHPELVFGAPNVLVDASVCCHHSLLFLNCSFNALLYNTFDCIMSKYQEIASWMMAIRHSGNSHSVCDSKLRRMKHQTYRPVMKWCLFTKRMMAFDYF